MRLASELSRNSALTRRSERVTACNARVDVEFLLLRDVEEAEQRDRVVLEERLRQDGQ